MERHRKTCAIGVSALAAAMMVCLPAAGEDAPEEIAACLGAVGTYLTRNVADGGDLGSFTSRSLLSFTNGGHVFFTDSGEAGGDTFAPFSDGRGAWRCISSEDGIETFVAVIVDFTFTDAAQTDQSIGRLDFALSYDERTRGLSGTGTLGFVAFDGDPMDGTQVSGATSFRLSGQRIEAP